MGLGSSVSAKGSETKSVFLTRNHSITDSYLELLRILGMVSPWAPVSRGGTQAGETCTGHTAYPGLHWWVLGGAELRVSVLRGLNTSDGKP